MSSKPVEWGRKGLPSGVQIRGGLVPYLLPQCITPPGCWLGTAGINDGDGNRSGEVKGASLGMCLIYGGSLCVSWGLARAIDPGSERQLVTAAMWRARLESEGQPSWYRSAGKCSCWL